VALAGSSSQASAQAVTGANSSGAFELVAALDSADASARAAAAWRLAEGTPGIREQLDRLGRVRDSDPDEGARLAATYACGRLATKEVTCPGSEYDQPPKPKKLGRPKYPDAAFRRRVQGSVNVFLLISERGSVVRAEIPRASTAALDAGAINAVKALDTAALDAVKKWTFEPARRRGMAVACWATAPVAFRIE
jgi:TonB family protein